jgi:hypothetical protein
MHFSVEACHSMQTKLTERRKKTFLFGAQQKLAVKKNVH